MKTALLATSILSLSASGALGAYQLAKEYSGQSFFDDWEFYGAPDLTTDGDVNWVTEANATAEHLAYVNGAGHAIIKVDNSTDVPYPDKRDTVRITTEDTFPLGSVFIIDAYHLPYGCSVWPSFWTKGPNWPDGGEIDIIETINLMKTNQYALHTGGTDCLASSSAKQTGQLGNTNCSSPTGGQAGCTVTESSDSSVGLAFAAAGGGVYATQFDTSGINIWFWNRADIPSDISSGANSVDPSTWGEPSAAYPSSSCNISEYFVPQQLVLDITLCGNWAGDPTIYASTCPVNGTPNANTCYYNNVINTNGSNYDTAYFEVSYVKAFTTNGSVAATNVTNSSTTSTSASGSASGSAASSTNTASAGSGGAAGNTSGAVSAFWHKAEVYVGAAVLTLAAWTMM
ncbi:glycoside hydrolase family 16 protein [Wolfiporia cocos MD-104 SS10]|uniref:Glycoside hydrolase family 16 protein n=1 Tax=Wolfiporia cocos (strain MD-104) TaxID=742152 RepID=A0A2H3K443_WOLCO|nr:glycoside hydrolase family 16 protein [Wolfiporia cocos MD-104 SS10]